MMSSETTNGGESGGSSGQPGAPVGTPVTPVTESEVFGGDRVGKGITEGEKRKWRESVKGMFRKRGSRRSLGVEALGMEGGRE